MGRWQSSRLSLGLKQKNKLSTKLSVEEVPTAATLAELPECRTNPNPPSNEELWHQGVERFREVLDTTPTSNAESDRLLINLFQQCTKEYLSKVQIDATLPFLDSSSALNSLINEHARRSPSTKDVAILACLSRLATPIAIDNLSSLQNINSRRYPRCIYLASLLNREIVSHHDAQVAQILVWMIHDPEQCFKWFHQLIETLDRDVILQFLPLPTIRNILVASNAKGRLEDQLGFYLQKQHYRSAFDLISWLKTTPKPGTGQGILDLMDECLPTWRSLREWKPNMDRISQWEHAYISEMHRSRLFNAFRLDGPDIATNSEVSLKLSEPDCFTYVQIRPQNQSTLDKYLNVLYRAHVLGPGALELFIHLCVDKPADEYSLAIVEGAVELKHDSYCSNLLRLLLGVIPQKNLSRQLSTLAQLLPNFNFVPVKLHSVMGEVARRICTIMEAAQEEFCAQLCSGPGDFIGMLIFELGSVINQTPALHSSFAPSILSRIQQFPPKDTLEAIFDQLEEDSGSDSRDARFKSYLIAALGGRGEPETCSMSAADIQHEMQFWGQCPNTLRRDLAKKIGTIRSVDYQLYTSCIIATLTEKDLYLNDMKAILSNDAESMICINLARYLAHRRRLDQMQNDCWLLLFWSLVKAQPVHFLETIAHSLPQKDWMNFADGLNLLMRPIISQLPSSGEGLTQHRLSWWHTLSQKSSAVKILIGKQSGRGNVSWLYFPFSKDSILNLLEILEDRNDTTSLRRRLISFLTPSRSNLEIIRDCFLAMTQSSKIGETVFERILRRKEESRPDTELSILFGAWLGNRSLTQADKSALKSMRVLLEIPQIPTFQQQLAQNDAQSISTRCEFEYKSILQRAKDLEKLRVKIQRHDPQRTLALLTRVGVECHTGGRTLDSRIPIDLIDAVECVGESEYEVAFDLTNVNNLQKKARGIPEASRLLLVHLRFQPNVQFCIHVSPEDEAITPHTYCKSTETRRPHQALCTRNPNLFTYYSTRQLYHLLRRGQFSWQTFHSAILRIVSSAPSTCLNCPKMISIPLWKPATCSPACSIELRSAPLEVRLHNLIVDPSSIDLPLTCIYASAGDTSLDLLPGCPVRRNIRDIIDSLPPLLSLVAAKDLRTAIHGTDGQGRERELLLSWLCLTFRGFMVKAQGSLRIPSMPQTRQFLLLNSSQEMEQRFNTRWASTGSGRVVFHGTRPSRLFRILTEGLKVMSHTPFMLVGAANGPGVYCGEDQATSLGFVGSTGKSWRNSTLGNMSLMLGCELAATGPPSQRYHVVKDENSLRVRYVFLLPPNYQPPPRRHVEPAMNIVLANLRSGTLS